MCLLQLCCKLVAKFRKPEAQPTPIGPMTKRKRDLTEEEIEAILFASHESVSDRSSEDDGWLVDDSLADVSFILNKEPGDEIDEDQANDQETANSASTFQTFWTGNG
ncbi:hypothetical protein AVEN_37068-1 [Araneus ventricosus]|uniref:Uncharacterized protein n=1 Tax=Araneus ventricosus TaxID=182803 RepID=A0A4Y2NPD7_ARAVE|nr:hypothetical protein AVEN_37068-1 [Araneus ventricosus]